jgi:putative transposase
LHESAYEEPGAICSITIAVKDRAPVFASAAVAAAAVGVLREHATKTLVIVHAYCFMPDHVHLVISPSDACSITTFVGQLKNLVQRAAWKLGVEGSFWQTSFWDHFLRKEEDIETVVAYVLNNPVRKGLVEDWRAYPYCGSLTLDLDKA